MEKIIPADINLAVEAKSEEFIELLDKIEYASKETKKLWKEIYENAVLDRSHAYLLYCDIYGHIVGSTDGHGLYGKLITQYLEKMNKSNDQLLKLAELVNEASGESSEIDAETLYNEIDKK